MHSTTQDHHIQTDNVHTYKICHVPLRARGAATQQAIKHIAEAIVYVQQSTPLDLQLSKQLENRLAQKSVKSWRRSQFNVTLRVLLFVKGDLGARAPRLVV